jgi:hypothetical protein
MVREPFRGSSGVGGRLCAYELRRILLSRLIHDEMSHLFSGSKETSDLWYRWFCLFISFKVAIFIIWLLSRVKRSLQGVVQLCCDGGLVV